ncbi:MAG: hypothetical protein M0P64_03205 [Candidatus Pacebacteria bacterium]|jgi:hypothetical protein|nr:hypothetical protein [Candidatus Paceibacterota bacterium]
MLKQILSATKIVSLAIVLSFGLSYALAWTAPAANPPAGNVSAPINASNTAQEKLGGLTVGSLTTAGAVTAGTLRVTTGAAASRVLTSDASGNATWQAAAGGSDNLGNHTATQALNMAGNNITSAGAITASGEVDATGGTGTGYSTAPIEVRTTLTPRISFHWPGVVASQLGMDSAGTIRTYDNPGTGYANFTAGTINATNRLNVSEAAGAYSYISMADDTSTGGPKFVHANSNVIGFLNGAGSWLSYWNNAGNQVNTGSVTVGGAVVAAGTVYSNSVAVCQSNGVNCPAAGNYNSLPSGAAGGRCYTTGGYPLCTTAAQAPAAGCTAASGYTCTGTYISSCVAGWSLYNGMCIKN